jgi:hypothetical protein
MHCYFVITGMDCLIWPNVGLLRVLTQTISAVASLQPAVYWACRHSITNTQFGLCVFWKPGSVSPSLHCKAAPWPLARPSNLWLFLTPICSPV